ncbi:uncharacterized protein LOC121235763 [Juglans microcarpa x Juglans regia]|uniref:uncharacterized protein LOC121235763 n=1 Tax=Juglans microcarpa x Juglans regia TaxID=2249226 RepID=UPI001B7DFA53|nr:uncharacterized protein LOC121235763 [Juglans microcarpa x Juglans regia]
MHAVWSCLTASDVWAEKDSSVNKWCSSDEVFVDWWVKLNVFLKEEELEVVACIMRKIWMRRNSFLFEKNFEHLKKLVTATTQGLKEFKAAQETVLLLQQKTQLQRKVDRSMIKWEKSKEREVKANWDAAVDVKIKKVAIGVVVRDLNGEVLACLCSCFINNSIPSVAEAVGTVGLRRAALLCTELGLSNVIFEGDSKLVVNVTISGEEIGAEYGSILEDVRRVMYGRLNWSIWFIYREANCIAHKLAKLAFNFSDERVWMEDSPIEIKNDVLEEKYCND